MCARLYRALERRMSPLEVDRLEFWQAAVMLGRDQGLDVAVSADQLARNMARAEEVRADRARRRESGQVVSRPDRMIRSA